MAQHVRVLVIEDDPGCATFFSHALNSLGWPSVAASSGNEALLACEVNNFDLLIVDVLLDGEAGSHVEAQIRRTLPAVKTLFISGYPVEELERQGLIQPGSLRGDSAFLQKPFTMTELRTRILALIGKREAVATPVVGNFSQPSIS